MATSLIKYEPTSPGRVALSPSALHYGPESLVTGQAPCGFMPANELAALFEKNMFPVVGGAYPYASGEWTVTTTGTSAAAAQAITAGGGVLLTCGSDSTFNTNLQSKGIWTPAAGKRVVALARIQTSDITTVGFEFNLGNSQVDPGTTNYTDVVGVKMGVGAGTVIGKVRGNSGTQAVSGTLGTNVAATEAFVGFHLYLAAAAADIQGGFWYGTSIANAVYTPFTSAQRTQALAILTTPPSMYLNLHAKGSASNPTVTFTSVLASIDR